MTFYGRKTNETAVIVQLIFLRLKFTNPRDVPHGNKESVCVEGSVEAPPLLTLMTPYQGTTH